MKRAEIRTAVERHLNALGFAPGSWLWQSRSAELIVVINGQIRNKRFRAGISKRELLFNLGVIQGWAEMAGLEPSPAKPTKINGNKHSGHSVRLREGKGGAPIHAGA